ncbi:hypothetical protein ACQU0X_28870 [Pseudovibrio ascidiaceicola]|uniref:hypothetical protein n=1 Tax=Pseudovibrio ascidiaceicola TaxID=285279 RepID=UPI003D36B6AB
MSTEIALMSIPKPSHQATLLSGAEFDMLYEKIQKLNRYCTIWKTLDAPDAEHLKAEFREVLIASADLLPQINLLEHPPSQQNVDVLLGGGMSVYDLTQDASRSKQVMGFTSGKIFRSKNSLFACYILRDRLASSFRRMPYPQEVLELHSAACLEAKRALKMFFSNLENYKPRSG